MLSHRNTKIHHFLRSFAVQIIDRKYNEQEFVTDIHKLDKQLQLVNDRSIKYKLVNDLYAYGNSWDNISKISLLFSCLDAISHDKTIPLHHYIQLLHLLLKHGVNALEQYRVASYNSYNYDTNEERKSYSILKSTIFKDNSFVNDDVIINNAYDIILSSSIPESKTIQCSPAIFSVFINNDEYVSIRHFFIGNSFKYPSIKQLEIAMKKLHFLPILKIIQSENIENTNRYRSRIGYNMKIAMDETHWLNPNILNQYINNCEYNHVHSFSYLYLISVFYNKYRTDFTNSVCLNMPNEIINLIINQFCFDRNDCINFIDLKNDKLLAMFCESLFCGDICDNNPLWTEWIETNILEKLSDKQLLVIKEHVLNSCSNSFDRIIEKCKDSILLFLINLLSNDTFKLINTDIFCELISSKADNISILNRIFKMKFELKKIDSLIWYEIWQHILFYPQGYHNASYYYWQSYETYETYEISYECIKCIWNLMIKHINYHQHKNCNFVFELLLVKNKLYDFCSKERDFEVSNLSNLLILIKNEFESDNYSLIYEFSSNVLLKCTEYANHKLLKSLICNNFFYFNTGISNQAYANLLPNNPEIFRMDIEKVNETKRLLKEWIAFNNNKINNSVLYL